MENRQSLVARSTSILGGMPGRREPLIGIPLDPNRGGDLARRAERAARWLWSRGIYPSPSAVSMRMRGRTRDCLNDVETKARNAVLAELGVPYQRKDRRFPNPGGRR